MIEREHFKSAGDPHPLCDVCMKVSQDGFCTTTDACELCKDLDKATWRRIKDTSRRGDSRIKQQCLTFGEITAIPLTDPSDSGFQGCWRIYSCLNSRCCAISVLCRWRNSFS